MTTTTIGRAVVGGAVPVTGPGTLTVAAGAATGTGAALRSVRLLAFMISPWRATVAVARAVSHEVRSMEVAAGQLFCRTTV